MIKAFVLSLTISIVGGLIIFVIALYITIKLFPPLTEEGYGVMPVGQVASSLLVAFLSALGLAWSIFKRIRNQAQMRL